MVMGEASKRGKQWYGKTMIRGKRLYGESNGDGGSNGVKQVVWGKQW